MRTWFITGAARGVGAATAARALALGDSVVVGTMRDPAHVRAALGAHEQLLVVSLDVTREEQARASVATALRRFGRIDVLVNNAGYGLLGAIEETSALEVERVFRANVFGLLNVTRAVLPQLRRQRSGHIVNVAAPGRERVGPGWGIYCATKFAVEAISEALSKECEPLGIHASVVEAGYPRRGSPRSNPLVGAVRQIDDYSPMVSSLQAFAGPGDGHHDDPDKLAEAIVGLVETSDPPRRLPMGSGTFRAVEADELVGPELESWRSLVLSTDFVS